MKNIPQGLVYICSTTHANERISQRELNNLFIRDNVRRRNYIQLDNYRMVTKRKDNRTGDDVYKFEEKGKPYPMTIVIKKGNGNRYQLITAYFNDK